MAYNSISIKPYIKSHLELQREITLIELAPSPYFFVEKICLAYMNMFARFNENPAMTLQYIKETKRYGRTHGQRENSIPPTNKVCGGYNKMLLIKYVGHMSLTDGHLGRHLEYFKMLNDARVASVGFIKYNASTTRINKEKTLKSSSRSFWFSTGLITQ